jgi:hypothetical protein
MALVLVQHFSFKGLSSSGPGLFLLGFAILEL